MLDLTAVTALGAAFVPFSWALLMAGLLATNNGFAYWNMETRDDAVADIAQASSVSLSAAALVFAGLTFVTSVQSGRLADLLLLSLVCFLLNYSSSYWPWSFTHQIGGDAFHWTGLIVFLAAVHEYTFRLTTGSYGTVIVGFAALVIALMSTRAAIAHWHNAKDAASHADNPSISAEIDTPG